MSIHKIGFTTAVSIVIANMIGVGVFTSLGFQVVNIHQPASILILWILGGVLSLCGALVYGEIGAAFPESGGEYLYLSRLYHPAVGFLSGWVSVTVGFSAPIAASAVALSKYVRTVEPAVNEKVLAICVIIGITLIHSFNLRAGSAFQRIFTYFKVLFILAFIILGLWHTPQHELRIELNDMVPGEVFSGFFAASLLYVMYAYSGWNAAVYIAGEIKDVRKVLPRALFSGTLVVAAIYTLLNFVFLRTVPMDELKGQVEVGYLSAEKMFGRESGNISQYLASGMSLTIALLLVSTISAMVLAGPRVMQSMGQRINGLGFFATSNKNNVPFVAIIFQSILAIVLVLTSSFEALVNYVGFTLNIFTFLTVLGIFVLRYRLKKVERPFKTPLYPLPPLIFLAAIGWMSYCIIRDKPVESMWGLGTVLLGLIIYFLTGVREKESPGDVTSGGS